MKKRILAILLTFCLIVAMPPAALAADADLTISNENELKAFAQTVNSGTDYAGKTVVLKSNITLSDDWTPIGNAAIDSPSYTGNAFKGTFDGGNYTISGLTNCLFGVVDNATVKNLVLDSVAITGTGERVGAAVRLMVGNSSVSSITVDGTISGAKYVGGIVGAMTYEGTISNCTNNASITGSVYNIGGIAGAAYYTASGKTMTVSGCKNNGTVSGPLGVGGIVGLSTADIINCTNTGAISGSNADVGGIVGEQKIAGSVIGCTNTANVTNTGSGYGTGGIIGWVRYPGYPSDDYGFGEVIEVSGNKNSGSVAGGNDAGGIAGVVYNAANVTGNENTAATITAATFAGGIVGSMQFSETVGGNLPQQTVNVENNISTTTLDNISANCKHLFAYDNSSGTQDGEIVNNSDAWVAQIGADKYTTLQTAINTAADGDTITVLTDVELTEKLLVTADDEIIIDLNGKTVSYETTESKADDMIVNKGILTITDSSEEQNGKLSYKYIGNADSSYSYDNATIQNEGTLTIEAGTVENTTAAMSHASYAINTNAGATLNVKGGRILNLNGHAIRQVSFGTAANTVNISGGYIEGTRAVQFHLPGGASAAAPEMALNISGGELKSNESTYNLAVYVYSNGQSAANASVSVSGDAIINGNVALNGAVTTSMVMGAASVSGGTLNGEYGIFSYASDGDINNAISITGGTFATNYSEIYAENDGYTFEENNDGTYGVIIDPEQNVFAAAIDGVGYTTLQAAIDAADPGDTVKVIANIQLVGTGITISSDKNIKLDLNGQVISGISNAAASTALIDNKGTLVIDDTSSAGTGKITSSATNPDTEWTAGFPAYANNTINNTGHLTINGGRIENATGDGYCIPIDNLLGGTLIVNGGHIVHLDGQDAIRMFCNSTTIANKVEINGGTIEGGYYAIWVHLPGSSATSEKMAELTINGGTLSGKEGEPAISVYSFGDSFAKVNVSIDGGSFESKAIEYSFATGKENDSKPTIVVSGGTFVDNSAEAYLADGYILKSYVDGGGKTVYGVEPVYTVTIAVTPNDATIVVKNSEGAVVEPETDGTYELVNGDYTYIVSKSGYDTKRDSFTVNGENKTITVSLTIDIPDVPSHTCTSKCEICGGCTDADCTESICGDKCRLLSMNFNDVEDGKWYSESIEYVYHHKMMEGIGNNLFDIDGTTTRAMIITLLWRLEGEPAVTYEMDFDDVAANTWYTEAVRWAANNKIVEGYGNGKFGTNDPITREQFATILYRYAQYKGYDVSVGENNNILSYNDALVVSEWASPAMQWACGSGLMLGDGVNLMPTANATRAQAAALFERFCENIIK